MKILTWLLVGVWVVLIGGFGFVWANTHQAGPFLPQELKQVQSDYHFHIK